MARADRLQFIVLAEGKRDYEFARSYLQKRFGKRRAEVRPVSNVMARSGSGEQKVRERFADELRALRAYGGQNRFLVVMTDGDRLSPTERRAQLEEQEPRRDSDRVAIIVPRRNLESWFAWLDGDFEDESKNYKPSYRNEKPRYRGQEMAKACGNVEIQSMPHSLQEACYELQRVT